jgi:hypothetical protein
MVDVEENSIVDPKTGGNRTIFFLPTLLLAVFIFCKVTSPECYLNLIQEDSPIETLQSIFFFLAIPFTLSIGLRLMKSHRTLTGLLYLFFSLCLLLVTLEEISWGPFQMPHLLC